MEQQKTWLFLLFLVKRTVGHVCLWKQLGEQQHRSPYESNKVLICASLAGKGPQFCKPSNSNSGLCKQPEEWLQICWLCVVCLSGITWGNEVTTGRNIVFSIFNKYQILRAGGPDEEKPGPSVCLGSWQSGRFSHTGKPLEKNAQNAIKVRVEIKGDHWRQVSSRWRSFCKQFLATCVFFPHLNINKAALRNRLFRPSLPSHFPPFSPRVFFSQINTVSRPALRPAGLQTRCLLWFSAAHVGYCATLAADAARRWKSKRVAGDAIRRG